MESPGGRHGARSAPAGSTRSALTSRRSTAPAAQRGGFFTLIVGLVSFALGLFLRTGPSGSHGWAVVAAVTGLAACSSGSSPR